MPLRLLKRFRKTSTSTISERSETPQPEDTYAEEAQLPVEFFSYEQLSRTGDEIRLLKRRRNGPQLSFDIFYVKHSVAPSYLALSHCREAETLSTDQREIFINGKPFPVGENLYQALSNDCISYGSCAWIDMICINQDDKQEKSQQAQRVPDIFSRATQTIVWLGMEHSDAIGPLFQLAQGFPQLKTQHNSDETWSINNASSIEENVRNSSTALQNLFTCPYWSRLWVLQEIALSKNIVVHCGPYACSLPAIEAIVYSSLYISNMRTEDSQTLRSILGMRQRLRQTSQSPTSTSVIELSSAHFAAVETQDMISSILGLLPKDLAITVDYTRSIEDTLVNLMRQRMFTEGPDILGEAQTNSVAKRSNLPSWVADLACPNLRSYTKQYLFPYQLTVALHQNTKVANTRKIGQGQAPTLCQEPNKYQATRTTKHSIQPCAQQNKIDILGKRINTIFAVANACSSTTFGSNRVHAWLSKQYKQQRFQAAEKWDKVLAVEAETDSTISFYNQPGEPFYPATEQQRDKLAWEQLMNPYATFPQYWALLDLTMGPSFRAMCSSDNHTDCPPSEVDEATDFDAFKRQIDFFDSARRAFRTTNGGTYGIGPEAVRPGDAVVLFHGAAVPHIIRRDQGADGWLYIGEAFVKGIMYGEAMDVDSPGEYFTLV